MYIYLAGTLSHYYKIDQMFRATKWRNEIINFCLDNNINYFDPVETFINNIKNKKLSSKLIVEQNKHYLNKTDILIVNLSDILKSPGTQWEIFYANIIRRIPIIAIGDKLESPHLDCITQYCKDTEEVIAILISMFHQSNF